MCRRSVLFFVFSFVSILQAMNATGYSMFGFLGDGGDVGAGAKGGGAATKAALAKLRVSA